MVFHNYHPLLPQLIKIRDDLPAAAVYVRHLNEKPDTLSAITDFLKPRLGTKVGRQPWFKGRSIKNCMDMLQGRQAVCEQKIDGEYCQIHIDLRKPHSCIQIFSKSGKDSTADRTSLHTAIRDSLKIGDKNCPLKEGCILEGELVVYSTKENKILPFHKIRKHVTRSGSFLGTANDSQAHEHEHLMIIYYDMLLIDDESLLGMKNSERFRRLSAIITHKKGYAELVPRTTIDTSRPSAVPILRELFAQCISSRGEGLVVKPDEPYFDFSTTMRRFGCCNIKLKKDYIQGWGDVGDFAAVGASYDAAKAREYNLPNVKWTHFFIGCLENSDQARAKTEMPRFRVTNVVELTRPMLSTFWAQRSPIFVPYEDNTSIRLSYRGIVLTKKPTVIFPCPLVFDMRCFGFDKEPNTNFWSMRFPQVGKIHRDRSYLDTIAFSKLQQIAAAAVNIPEERDSQEMRQWITALEKRDRGKFLIDAMSQETNYSNVTASPLSSELSQLIPQPRKRNLPTSPTSSATEAAVLSTGVTPSALSRAKRPVSELSEPKHNVKRHRTHSSPLSMDSSQEINPTSTSTHRQQREPLSQLEPDASKNNRPRSQPSSSIPVQEDIGIPVEKLAASSPTAYDTASEMISSSPSRTITPRRSSVTALSQRSLDKRTFPCSIAQDGCALANCSILLSPCISSYAWVMDDLLKRHGITDPLLDPRVWNNVGLFTSMSGSVGGSVCEPASTETPGRQRRVRKICLVESRRKEATKAFLQKIKDANLVKTDGKREWVTVYDWKVLESITDQESKKDKSSSRATDPWRRFYVGVV
ncbi:putative ATP dependent DNA ligase domain-containing protein [Rosellinia necatrix]|uniref:Putative ATP dependent DNA ligase domain-containing protein n=1 Tax=Rosellinia necatrix TaxID=77044 RepID=A0A1W2TQ30_ROSNE|nr:putative ATP dependent DNA ligase domain-containing protein [Rosellinia necatrix]